MAIQYELRVSGIATGDGAADLVEITSDQAQQSDRPLVAVLTPPQFCDLALTESCDLETFDTLTDSESNYVDIYPGYLLGSFSVPSRSMDATDPDTFAFYMDKRRLIFFEKGDLAERVMQKIAASGVLRSTSAAHCLYVFMKALMADDLDYMGEVEDRMEDIEEDMMEKDFDITASAIMRYRRMSMRFSAFYQQMATMAAMLSDDENKLMTSEETSQFDHLENLADRLEGRAGTLREYSLQLHELHQTRIDLRQNSIMQVLTIVTVLLAPMTIVTGWFGMNLGTIPGLSLDVMWIILLVAFATCTALLLLIFHKKRWI